jgi:hypothetical protein
MCWQASPVATTACLLLKGVRVHKHTVKPKCNPEILQESLVATTKSPPSTPQKIVIGVDNAVGTIGAVRVLGKFLSRTKKTNLPNSYIGCPRVPGMVSCLLSIIGCTSFYLSPPARAVFYLRMTRGDCSRGGT